MSFLVILLAAFLLAGLVLAGVLLWVCANAILNGRGRESVITVASLRRALQSIYDGTLRESLPRDFHALLGKLPRHSASNSRARRVERLVAN